MDYAAESDNYCNNKVHDRFRVTDSEHDEFDMERMLWGHGTSFAAFFEALGMRDGDVQQLRSTAVYKFDIAGEGPHRVRRLCGPEWPPVSGKDGVSCNRRRRRERAAS